MNSKRGILSSLPALIGLGIFNKTGLFFPRREKREWEDSILYCFVEVVLVVLSCYVTMFHVHLFSPPHHLCWCSWEPLMRQHTLWMLSLSSSWEANERTKKKKWEEHRTIDTRGEERRWFKRKPEHQDEQKTERTCLVLLISTSSWWSDVYCGSGWRCYPRSKLSSGMQIVITNSHIMIIVRIPHDFETSAPLPEWSERIFEYSVHTPKHILYS